MKRCTGILFPVIFILLIADCSKENAYYPETEKNNINDEALHRAIVKAESDGGILSIIVFRNNDIITEEYFGGNTPNTYHPVKSVTKTVTGMLFGIAKDMGLITDLNVTVKDYLSDYLRPEDTLVAKLTIRHLLSMTGGFDWFELGTYDLYNDWALSEDHLTYALQVPIIDSPGSVFTYTTPGCQILSAIFTEATGQKLEDFAWDHLFPYLGISGERPWNEDIHDYNYGGVTLNLTAPDMLAIGRMFLNNGEYDGKQIVSQDWIPESTSTKISFEEYYFSTGYAYLLWTGEKEGVSYFFANGYGGQFIFVYPSLNLVVVAQSEIDNPYRNSGSQWYNTISLIMEDIFDCIE
jgi:CubicO group peptidase (beta-lactamase class C family)